MIVAQWRRDCRALFVSADVQRFRLLYFRESVLEAAEEIEARDVLEAIERALGKPPHIRVEVWSDKGRAAEIGTSLRHN
jgi:hypothetical protein